MYRDNENVRFFEVQDRTATTLTNLIVEHIEEGSVIVTDQWAGYNRLNDEGFHHFTVNHSENYVDPRTKYHTQGIERSWSDCKASTKAARGANHHLQFHLDEVAWRKSVSNSERGLFAEFWCAVKDVHSNDE